MFTIVISEKGGAERRETFEKNEINVGRVQGNDLLLPKGNVSKHHARLLYRDGRFIVTDLKSTNGTYVNGRKISQATIVREGDKIYVGDFVLRVETGQKIAAQSEDDGPPRASSSSRDGAQGGPAMSAARPPLPPPLPAGVAHHSGPAAGGVAMIAPPVSSSAPRLSEPGVSHYPLERDPDDSESSPDLPAGRAPKSQSPLRQSEQPGSRTGGSTMSAGGERAGSMRDASPPSGAPARVGRSVPPPRPAPRETPQQAAHRLALITLVDRVGDVLDLAPLDQSPWVAIELSQAIDRALREQAKAMRDEGEAPDGIDLDLLAREGLRELVGLGPVGPLLEDDETTQVHVMRPDYVLASRGGPTTLVNPSFTSEEALARVIARLAHQSGDPLDARELVIDRRLPRGAYMIAIAPPAASGWVLHVRKRRRIESSLGELVRSGAMSEAMAMFLEASAAVRANVLVVGSGAGAVTSMLCAIASAAPHGERVAILQPGGDEIVLPHAHVVPLALADHGPRGEESVYAAARLAVDRLIVTSLGGAVATATIDIIAEGTEAVLAGVGAPSLRHALARLVSQVAITRAGSSVVAAREAIAESFDVAVEVERIPTGRLRVVRVAELEGTDDHGVITRDLFVLGTNDAGEPAYSATGVSARIMRDFAGRGGKWDGLSVPKRPGQ